MHHIPWRAGRRFVASAARHLLSIHPEVAEALARDAPVVALESTVITHGLSYPDNLKTAISCEDNVRAFGAVPATIALLEGRVHVGLDRGQLEILADVDRLRDAGKPPIKLSRRDLAPAMSLGRYGGTTIAGTAVLAHLAGIKVFATGGLGGVHRGGEKSMDISADLTELGRTPIAVVASGAKSILDIGRTLEYLETQGVTVAAYDNDGNWPAFFTSRSGYKAPWAVDNPKDAAKMIYYADQLGLCSGTIFGVPIPKQFEASGLEIQAAVDQAVRESEENGVAKSGRDATPWLLARVREITGGLSLPSNVALLENNARIGASIAVEYSNLKTENGKQTLFQPESVSTKFKNVDSSSNTTSPLVVVGAAAVDIIAQPYSDSPSALHSTARGSVRLSSGGVARNIAEAAHRVLESFSATQVSRSNQPLLISPIGRGPFGTFLRSETRSKGMRTDGLIRMQEGEQRTATCNMLLNARGELQMGVADMSIVDHAELDSKEILNRLEAASPKIVAFDGNLSTEVISDIVEKAKRLEYTTFFEPTSTAKCTRVIPALTNTIKNSDEQPYITGAFPNVLELRCMWEAAKADDSLLSTSYWWSIVDTFGPDLHRTLAMQARGRMSHLINEGIIQMAIQLLPFIKNLVIKRGDQGVVVVSHVKDKTAVANWITGSSRSNDHQIMSKASDGSVLVVKNFPAHSLPEDVPDMNVTGAGDTLVGSLLAVSVHHGNIFASPSKLNEAIDLGQRCAVETIKSPFAVSPSISSLK